MDKRRGKKGFTIAELVIVIVVIVVLAAILIPLFANLIARAKLSVDQQTVDGMNKVLQSDEALSGKPKSLNAAKAVLESNNYRGNITPTSKNHEFYWIPADNKVVLVKMNGDSPESIVYPKDMVKKYAGDFPTTWYNLGDDSDDVICSHENRKYVAIADGNTSTAHMEICSECNTVTIPSEAHDTAGADGACSKCGWKAPAEGDSHVHAYTTVFLSDCNGHHYGVCSCGVLGPRVDCTYDSNGVCVGCHYAKPTTGDNHEHKFTYTPTSPYNGKHTKTCSVEGCSIRDVTEDCAYGLNKKCIYCGADMPGQGGDGQHTHSYSEWTSNGDGTHSRSCSCGDKQTENCQYENNVCTVCRYSTVRNGLVNGIYYKDDEPFTGTENGYTFKNGNLVILTSKKEYSKDTLNDIVASRTYTYEIPNASEYLTDKVLIDGDNSAYDSPATINIEDKSGKSYTVKTVKSVSPFGGLLDKNGWTYEDIIAYLMNAGGKSSISNGYILDSTLRNKLTGYDSETYVDPDAYDLFIPKLCADSELVKAYLALNGCGTVDDYYNAYQNNSLIIGFADYLRLLYGKGYALTKENGTIKYSKSYGARYQSGLYNDFYITVSPNETTGYPEISFIDKYGNTYMTAPTTTDGKGNLIFCDYVNGFNEYNQTLKTKNKCYFKLLGSNYYMSIIDNTVIMREGSLSGEEYCRFEIDNINHVIKTYVKSVITDANGLPFTLPSSGTVTLDKGKISLTGAFDVSNVTVSASDLSELKGSNNSSYVMFDTALVELIVKAAYKGTMKVSCGGSTYDVGNVIPGEVFTKSGDGVLSATFEGGFSPDDIYTLLKSNIFNGIDYAGPTFEIILEKNN